MKIVCLFVCTFVFVLVTEIQATGVPAPTKGPPVTVPPVTEPPVTVPPTTEPPRCQCTAKQVVSDKNRSCRTCDDLNCPKGWVCRNVLREKKRRCCRCEPVCVKIIG